MPDLHAVTNPPPSHARERSAACRGAGAAGTPCSWRGLPCGIGPRRGRRFVAAGAAERGRSPAERNPWTSNPPTNQAPQGRRKFRWRDTCALSGLEDGALPVPRVPVACGGLHPWLQPAAPPERKHQPRWEHHAASRRAGRSALGRSLAVCLARGEEAGLSRGARGACRYRPL